MKPKAVTANTTADPRHSSVTTKKQIRIKAKRPKTDTRDASKPSPQHRSGHQMQLPKPSASLWGKIKQAFTR
jgi:hypothetical protein